MDELNLMQNQQPAPGGEPSLVAPPPGEATDPMGQGVTDKDQWRQIIDQIPVEQLIQMVQKMPPDQLAKMIQDMLVQQGMDPDEAISTSITLMKVIFEKVQEATGKPITELTGQTPPSAEPMEPSLVQNPPMEQGGAV